MKSIKYLLLFQLFFMFNSCKTTHGNEVKGALDLNKENVSNESKVKDTHDKLTFHCGGDTVMVFSENLRWTRLPEGLPDCLYISGFNGNKSSNEQIASIINTIGYKFRYVFMEDKYRGPQIFEALLNKAGEFKSTSIYIGFMYKMIKSMDGFQSGRLHMYVYEANGLDSMRIVTALGFEEDVEHTKLTYRTIKKPGKQVKLN